MATDSIRQSTTEELRLKNYRTSLQQKNDAEIRDIEAKQQDDVAKLTQRFADQQQELRHAYEIVISQEAESMDEKLQAVRQANEARIESEKKQGEDEIVHVKSAYQQRVDDYRKNQDAQLEALRATVQKSAEDLHNKERKLAKRDKEVSST